VQDSEEHPTSRLRLAFASHRLRSFQSQLSAVAGSNFPHVDAREALEFIRAHADLQTSRLAIDPASDPAVVDGICEQVAIFVQRYTRTLGFILRSTNVRNPFELHYHLKKFVTSLIGGEARLILSSEWEFIPFTYPMTLALLPAFALVGLPASESDNVLVTPLAGHEIGHSAWLYHKIGSEIEGTLASNIDGCMETLAAETQRVIETLRLGEFGKQVIRQHCLSYGMLQLEEIFCDTIGVGFFGTAYLHSYEYFLAPGGGTRALEYPSDSDRLSYLKASATKLGVPFDESIFERWQDSTDGQGSNKDLVTILDAAVEKTVDQTIDRAADLLASKGVSTPNSDVVNRILAAFERSEPDAEGGSLPEVVSAGWEYVRHQNGLAADGDVSRFRTLGDLMLKSVEVAEFLERTKDA